MGFYWHSYKLLLLIHQFFSPIEYISRTSGLSNMSKNCEHLSDGPIGFSFLSKNEFSLTQKLKMNKLNTWSHMWMKTLQTLWIFLKIHNSMLYCEHAFHVIKSSIRKNCEQVAALSIYHNMTCMYSFSCPQITKTWNGRIYVICWTFLNEKVKFSLLPIYPPLNKHIF